MNTVDLSRLEALTRDYAAFQARKSGLATALGGLMALLLIIVPIYQPMLDFRPGHLGGLQLMLATPLIWLALKGLLARWLYRGFGHVKCLPDVRAERTRWFCFFGISVFLGGFLTVGLVGFTSGVLGLPRDPAVLARAIEKYHWALPPVWMMAMPLLYLLAAPWWIRGVEEARAYAVLVVQCCLWVWQLLVFAYLPWREGPEHMGFTGATIIGVLALALAVTGWGALAMIRGWKEHREYLALLRTLPPAGEE